MAWGGLRSLLVPNVARVAVIALGVTMAALAFAFWSAGNRNNLTDGVVLLGATASALILLGAVATPEPTRTTVRRRGR